MVEGKIIVRFLHLSQNVKINEPVVNQEVY